MNLELKKAIFAYMCDNAKEFQLVNSTIENFRQYIYLPNGEYCISGDTVRYFILLIDKAILL